MLRLVLELVLGKPCARRGYLVALLHLMAQCSQGQVASRNLGGPLDLFHTSVYNLVQCRLMQRWRATGRNLGAGAPAPARKGARAACLTSIHTF